MRGCRSLTGAASELAEVSPDVCCSFNRNPIGIGIAIKLAVADARIQSAEQATAARLAGDEQVREAIRLMLEQWSTQEGRRLHKPGGA